MKRFCFFFLLSSMAFGQGVVVPTQQALGVVNGITSPVANATITVCAANASGIPCTPVLPSALFKDAALTQPLTNPFTATATGNYVFAIAPGNYTVTVTGLGFAGYSYQTTAPLAAAANNTFSGTNTFSGPTNLNAGGSLVGTFGGPTTLSSASTAAGPLTGTVASGTAVMTTAAISAGTCGTTVTVVAANVATTDTITWAFNAAPNGTQAGLVAWPTSGNVNFAYCGIAETPAAATINWKVVR